MKKIIVILICLCTTLIPCFAGNLLQQQSEIEFAKQVSNDPLPTDYGKDYLIREDYYGYWNGKNAFYGYVVNGLEDVEKFKNVSVNKHYLQLIKSKIEIIVSLQNNEYDKNMRQNFTLSKIIVDDEDFKKLSDNTKFVILMYNYIISGQ